MDVSQRDLHGGSGGKHRKLGENSGSCGSGRKTQNEEVWDLVLRFEVEATVKVGAC